MSEVINFNDIIIPKNRIRKKFSEEHIEQLAESLASKGYIHPIVLRNDSNELVSGENRYRAHRLLLDSDRHPLGCPDGSVQITRLSDLSPDDLLEAELEENLLRKDLTWQEEAQAIARLHELRQSQNIDWTFADTANELQDSEEGPATGGQRTKVSESIILSEHLDDPLIAAAKTRKDAIKAVKEKNKHKARMDAAADFEEFLNGKTNADGDNEDLHTLILGNYFDEVEHIPDGTYSVILTDPPYGIDIHRKGTFDIDVHEYDDSKDYFSEIINSLASETFRITTSQAHCYVFCDIRRWPDIETAFFAAGWNCWPRPLIWHKGNIGSFANSDIGPRSTYECIFYGIKGHKQVQHNDMDVICVNQSTRSDHPANKPVELYSNLLQRSAFPGERVIDLFCGSGPIFPAASKHKMIATGIELNPKYHAMAHERLVETMK